MLLKIYGMLNPEERNKVVLILFMVLIMAFLEVLGAASIVPFIAVLSNPDLVHESRIFRFVFSYSQTVGVRSIDQFMYVLGILLFVMLVITLSFKALTTYVQTRFLHACEYGISSRLVEGYIRQPYSWFLARNSSDLGKNILSEVNSLVENGILPLMTLITQLTVAIALLILLIAVDPTLAFIVGLTLSFAYSIIFFVVSGILKKLGQARVVANQKRFLSVSEAFGAIKELKVSGLERAYVDRFSIPARTYSRVQASAQVIGSMPRFALEVVAFGGLLLVILYLMSKLDTFEKALPIISLYAFAGYRLMPSLQQIYSSLTQLKFAARLVETLFQDYEALDTSEPKMVKRGQFTFDEYIRLEDVSYVYPNSASPALKSLNLCIQANTVVAFVGSTGSGKTTVVDVILGLLVSTKGQLIVDGQVVTKDNLCDWQSMIGYVPQHIFLTDDTVAANIAFGVPACDVDLNAVWRAAEIAQLHDFIVNDLSDGYDTLVGERGVRLSGGQRQRIGIARALYRDPKLLILDEGTSALDNVTERKVMSGIHKQSYDTTVILIAHRLSTVRYCDQIFVMDSGEIVGSGTFDNLKNTSHQFKLLAQ